MPIQVNGETISPAAITRESDNLRPYYQRYTQQQKATANEDELRHWAVENLIEQTLLRQEAQKTIPHPSEQDVDRAFAQCKDQLKGTSEESARPELASHLMVEQLINSVTQASPEPSPDEIEQFYLAHKAMFKMPEQVHASHIVKHVASPADDAKARLEMESIVAELAKGVPFEELASSHSDCRDDAGDLGFFPRGRMVQEFEDVVFSLNPGQVSGIFSSSFGYHIAKVHERRPPATASLNEVKDYIKNELTRHRCQHLLEQFVDKLKAEADIVRDDEVMVDG